MRNHLSETLMLNDIQITSDYRIGSKKYSSDRLCENWNLSWGKTTFTVLGINFDVDISKITKINYEKYLKKNERTL